TTTVSPITTTTVSPTSTTTTTTSPTITTSPKTTLSGASFSDFASRVDADRVIPKFATSSVHDTVDTVTSEPVDEGAPQSSSMGENTTPSGVAEGITGQFKGGRRKPKTTRMRRRKPKLKARMSRPVLDGLQTERSKCEEKLNSAETAASSLPMDVETGPYPCDGGSGQLLCATREGQTCHRFGGPWKYGAFAVREAIEHHLGNGTHCMTYCDGKAEAIRHVWEETGRNLLSIPPCPKPGFLDFTADPSEPDLNDFEVMMRPRYPIVEECSGVCRHCLEDTHARKCSCSFVHAKCRIQAKGEKVPQVIELMDYNTQPGELFGHLSPFNKKLGLYDVLDCDYECYQPGPNLDAKFATGVDVRIVETEPTGDGSPLNSRLSRRELSSLQRPLAMCKQYPKGDWRQVEETGRYPCNGQGGIMMCGTNIRQCSIWKPWSSCDKSKPVSC
ncbi:hypothetical protein GNI_104880, partial [Gregarina niphandrodes]